jgi:hypothetical protein
VDAYAVHGGLFGIELLPAAELAAGQDYRIGEATTMIAL